MTVTPEDEHLAALNAKALTAAAEGDLDGANECAERAADAGSLLGVALSTYLRTSKQPDVYDRPAAFEAFIGGGGNIDLYQRTSAALARNFEGVGSLLDIGCGNGMALVPALRAGPTVPSVIDLVEPGAELLTHALTAITETGMPIRTTAWQMGLTEFLVSAPVGQHWQLTQSTFALQSVEPTQRSAALAALSTRTDRLVVVEFDASTQKEGGQRYLRELAARYERGLAEYDETRDLVAQGFLMPVLLGQISSVTQRTNWEHPAETWMAQVQTAGFTDVGVEPLADYWSAPAFLLTANGT